MRLMDKYKPTTAKELEANEKLRALGKARNDCRRYTMILRGLDGLLCRADLENIHTDVDNRLYVLEQHIKELEG